MLIFKFRKLSTGFFFRPQSITSISQDHPVIVEQFPKSGSMNHPQGPWLKIEQIVMESAMIFCAALAKAAERVEFELEVA